MEKEYIESLPEKERKTLEIAKEHLETSFSMEKSIGFQKWKQQQQQQQQQ
jgi:hypothetical protein